MKINTALLLMALSALMRGCAAVPPQPVRQAPAPKPKYEPPRPVPSPASTGAMTKPVSASWRDAPQTPGAWTYSAEAGGSAARFGLPGAAPQVVIRCDRGRPAVLIQREGSSSDTPSAAITTSSGMWQLSTAASSETSAGQNGSILFEIVLHAGDPLLDAMAFSRGRFMLEMGGTPTLVLPAWAEIGRVVEDCR